MIEIIAYDFVIKAQVKTHLHKGLWLWLQGHLALASPGPGWCHHCSLDPSCLWLGPPWRSDFLALLVGPGLPRQAETWLRGNRELPREEERQNKIIIQKKQRKKKQQKKTQQKRGRRPSSLPAVSKIFLVSVSTDGGPPFPQDM